MRKKFLVVIVLLLAALMFSSACAEAGRFVDKTDTLTALEKYQLLSRVNSAAELYSVDCVIYIADTVDGVEYSDFCTNYFEENGYGCGEEHDGLMLLVDLGQSYVYVQPFGGALSLFSDTAVDELLDAFIDAYTEKGMYKALGNYLDKAFAICAGAQYESVISGFLNNGNGLKGTLPSWYPESISSFQRTHIAEDASRVVDNADLFTEEEEAEFEATLLEMRERLGIDFVLYTDNTSYGFSRAVCAADFYEFNGYGIGDDYNGLVLFICMESGNRGWWTAAHGPCRSLITEYNLNGVDDRIEDYMRALDFPRAMRVYFSNMNALYTNGSLLKSEDEYYFMAACALAAGIIIGLVVRLVAGDTMKKVKTAKTAFSNIVPGSFVIRAAEDMYLYSTYIRTKRSSDSNSGSSRGGGSSYSSSYSSSSGSSYSGGGRSF